MKNKLILLFSAFLALFLIGCGAEKTQPEETEEKQQVISQQECKYGENGKITLGMYEDRSFFFSGDQLTEEEAVAMVTYIDYMFKDQGIDYSVFAGVNDGQLYVSASQKGDLHYAFGSERDGNYSLVMPRWVNEIGTEDFFSGEKFSALSKELTEMITEFLESMSK